MKAATALLSGLLLTACVSSPPRTIRLPKLLSEASGLAIHADTLSWHNDSGDGPYLYHTDTMGRLLAADTLAAGAVDYEAMAYDGRGRFYLGDIGDNRHRRGHYQIYRFDPATRRTDTIGFRYADGTAYNCEALFFYQDSLHLFTKDDIPGRSRHPLYHFRLPATPGEHVAERIDSLVLKRRVVTGASLSPDGEAVVLTAYTFRFALGFLPMGAASTVTLTDFPPGRFLRGNVRRRNVAWAIPTQFEAVDFWDEKYFYIASEATVARRRAVAKRRRLR